jgi:hypothetical protein
MEVVLAARQPGTLSGRPTMSKTPRYASHDGFLLPLQFPVGGFASGLRYQAEASDVFVITYPKCGTTWMQHIVWLLAHGGRPLRADQQMTETFPHLEEVGRELIERRPEPRLIKTHLGFSMTPQHPQAHYIWVARNPFDCAVSFFHHTRGFVQHYDFADGTFDDFFECFMDGQVDFGSYFDHLGSWGARRDEPNVLFTTFEAMRADPRAIVVDVGRFLGGPFEASVDDPAVLERVLEHSSFASMREDQQRWSSTRSVDAPPFIRKGVVGDWESYFSAAQAQRLVAKLEACTAGTWMASLWPDVLERARSR